MTTLSDDIKRVTVSHISDTLLEHAPLEIISHSLTYHQYYRETEGAHVYIRYRGRPFGHFTELPILTLTDVVEIGNALTCDGVIDILKTVVDIKKRIGEL